MMRVLFVGESWQGSNARSLCEALSLLPDLTVCDVAEDHFLPKHRTVLLRIINRILAPLQRRELAVEIIATLKRFLPDAVVFYKGPHADAALIRKIHQTGVPVVNVFPDHSPNVYGRRLTEALGCVDLVISTKPYHPSLWQSTYGYQNSCVCVPHGYDPALHYWAEESSVQIYDVALCATWRPEYQCLMTSFAKALGDDRISVAVGGPGWNEHRQDLPQHWCFVGARTGRSYGEFLRSARVAIAPLNSEVVVGGIRQLGDVDTSRTYELAAAHCFFLHQRSAYVATKYDEDKEVPLWSDAGELASLVKHWLPRDAERRTMAANAHARAVPAYSITEGTSDIVRYIKQVISARNLPSAKT